jgi:hypothetical protein
VGHTPHHGASAPVDDHAWPRRLLHSWGENWGSAGCIDLTYGMASFAKVIEPMSNCHIPVVVDYSGTTRVPAPS